MAQLITTKDLVGRKVLAGKKRKHIGKVHALVFHPRRRKCVGVLVKRPDVALMFKRQDVFAAWGAFGLEEKALVLPEDASTTDKQSRAALDASLDDCILWVGMPVLAESGKMLGFVNEVRVNAESGDVESLVVGTGSANDVLLGIHIVDAKLVLGFKRGVGVALAQLGTYDGGQFDETTERGAIVVADEAVEASLQGGVAAAAGAATGRAVSAAKKGASAVQEQASRTVERVRPAAEKAAQAVGDAVDKGAYAVGKQIGKSSGLFESMKESFYEGLNGDDEDDD